MSDQIEVVKTTHLPREIQKVDTKTLLLLEQGCVDGIWLWDRSQGQHLWTSPKLQKMLGYDEIDVVDSVAWWKDKIHPEDLGDLELISQGLENKSHLSFDKVLRYRHKNEQLLNVRCRASVSIDSLNRVQQILAVNLNQSSTIEQQTPNRAKVKALAPTKGSEQVLKGYADAYLRRFNLLFSQSPIGNAIVDQYGVIQVANPALAQMFGYASNELDGMSLHRLVAQEMLSSAGLGNPGGLQVNSDVVGTTNTGGRIVLSLGSFQIPTMGQGTEHLLTFVNRTDYHKVKFQVHKYVSELSKSGTDLEDYFNQAVAHDLQTPLRGIHNLLIWLQEDLVAGTDVKIDHHIDRLVDQADRMRRLIDGLLLFSTAGSQKSQVEAVHLDELIRENWAVLESMPNASLIIRGEMPVVSTFATPLAQCLRNLMDNAVKHNNKIDATVTVSCTKRGEWLRFNVEDNGPGIPHQYQGMVFEFLKTLKPKSLNSGPGLGLTLVSRLVTQLGGEVGLESDGGSGSKFWFTWPFYR